MIGLVLAGGTGTRLWPVSREMYPKQFLSLNGDTSLLRRTVQRVDDYVDQVVVATSGDQFFYVRDELEDLVPEKNILTEPEKRDTGPAIALATLFIKENFGDEPFLVLPSDHVLHEEFFQQAEEFQKFTDNHILTFGIEPGYAATGYGYIDPGEELDTGIHEVKRFIEKPGEDKAETLLENGCFWNAGIFMTKPSTVKQQFKGHAPGVAEHLMTFRHAESVYDEMPKVSFDYAVMEKTSDVAMVPYLGEWRDIGDWKSVHELMEKDGDGNAVKADAVTKDTENSLIYSHDDRLITTIGLNDIAIVDTGDALLVTDKNRSQDVKKLVKQLRKQDRKETETHLTVHKPWGYYTSLDEGGDHQVKRLCIHPGESISLQLHHHRAEHWIVVQGTAKVTKGEEEFFLHENESTYIPKTTKHRLENPGETPLHIVEIQTGNYLEEDDIERFEDSYGRTET